MKNAEQKIILEITELEKRIRKYKREKQRIVLTQGVFDLVHIGHARYCEEAKKYGDVLIVGVDSDEKVRTRKGPDRPVVPQEERLEMLTYLRSVDLVFLKEMNEMKFNLIKTVSPEVLVVTRENYDAYKPEQIAELQEFCGEIVVMEPQATTSTSAKIRLLQMGAAKKISTTLSEKLIKTIEEVLVELKA